MKTFNRNKLLKTIHKVAGHGTPIFNASGFANIEAYMEASITNFMKYTAFCQTNELIPFDNTKKWITVTYNPDMKTYCIERFTGGAVTDKGEHGVRREYLTINNDTSCLPTIERFFTNFDYKEFEHKNECTICFEKVNVSFEKFVPGVTSVQEIYHSCPRCWNKVCATCVNSMMKTGDQLICPFCKLDLRVICLQIEQGAL
jgi:hypothetical protein